MKPHFSMKWHSVQKKEKVHLQIVIKNTCVKFHHIWSRGEEDTDPDEQTDRRTNLHTNRQGNNYIYPISFSRGYIEDNQLVIFDMKKYLTRMRS